LLLNAGMGAEEIGMLTGYSRAQAFRLKTRFLKEGVGCLRDKRLGSPKELLSKKERTNIIEMVKNKTPKEVGLFRDHWTTGLLGRWIEREFKVKYKSKTSLYLIFRQAKFTYHKPGRVYDKRDSKAVAAWREEYGEKLKQLKSESETVILAADEMILTTETTTQKVWLPQGEFPKIECSTGGRKRRSIYGFLNVRTGQVHAFKTEFQTMHVTRDILKKIRSIYPSGKIVLFWDHAGWHKGSVVQDFIHKDEKIEVVHFPTYAPDENPQEHIWKAGRSQVTHNRFIENIDTATDELVSFFNQTTFHYTLADISLIS